MRDVLFSSIHPDFQFDPLPKLLFICSLCALYAGTVVNNQINSLACRAILPITKNYDDTISDESKISQIRGKINYVINLSPVRCERLHG
jgi:hypothetical protein